MTMQSSTHKNPFFFPFGTPRETFPFPDITVEDIEEAVREGIRQEDAEVAAIAEQAAPPTFENTVAALDGAGGLLERATAVMYNLLSAETSDRLDELAQQLAPVIADHEADVMLNPRLFARVKAVREGMEAAGLDAGQRQLVEKTYEAFERSGAGLDASGQQRFREITAELSRLSLRFSQNCLKETNARVLHVTDEADLEGLPPTAVEQAAREARERGLGGWVFTMQAPSYRPFMMYARRRRLRRQLYMDYNTRCAHGDEWDNFEVVRRLVELRRQLAALLGYSCYADYALRRRMAGNVARVDELYRQLLDNYLAPARREVAEVEALAREEEGPDFRLEPWDFAYYADRLKRRRFDVDAEALRPYFGLSRVKEGVFGLAERLYGIRLRRNPDIPVYHPEVEAYEAFDADGRYLAVLYADFYPRPGKQGGAWMTTYKEQWRGPDGADSRPHVAICTNFTRPSGGQEAQLTLDEVETFLHEFGHALHAICSEVRFRSLSCTNVYWDFVELPSQFMENYATEKEFLCTFARHCETGSPLPEELLRRIVAARNFNVAYACMRQVSFGLLDMAYYRLREPLREDVASFERAAWAPARLLPEAPGTCMSVQFGHIMSGGYAAGYYSYKWAEVLDADAFSLFRQRGIFDRETAASFRQNILSRGGTADPMELYVRFRGRKPTIGALLARNGIAQSPAPSAPEPGAQPRKHD